MCLIVFAYKQHPDYSLIVAANRDEFYSRLSAPLGFWPHHADVLAGRDLQAGGTWLGINRNGRFAALTNYREASAYQAKVTPRSRGQLVSDFLLKDTPATDYLAQVAAAGTDYNGFNLLVKDSTDLYYYCNRADQAPQTLAPGLYGLSNHLLDTAWPKVLRAKQHLAALLDNQPEPTLTALLDVVQDRWQPADQTLPDTGIGLSRERMLAPLFITGPDYGTRSSSAVLMRQNGSAHIAEITHPDASLRQFGWDSDSAL